MGAEGGSGVTRVSDTIGVNADGGRSAILLAKMHVPRASAISAGMSQRTLEVASVQVVEHALVRARERR